MVSPMTMATALERGSKLDIAAYRSARAGTALVVGAVGGGAGWWIGEHNSYAGDTAFDTGVGATLSAAIGASMGVGVGGFFRQKMWLASSQMFLREIDQLVQKVPETVPDDLESVRKQLQGHLGSLRATVPTTTLHAAFVRQNPARLEPSQRMLSPKQLARLDKYREFTAILHRFNANEEGEFAALRERVDNGGIPEHLDQLLWQHPQLLERAGAGHYTLDLARRQLDNLDWGQNLIEVIDRINRLDVADAMQRDVRDDLTRILWDDVHVDGDWDYAGIGQAQTSLAMLQMLMKP
jgi:hypothetical protein